MTKRGPLEAFAEALKRTRIVRARKHTLYTFGNTNLPYLFLAQSGVNAGDVVLRRGKVTVERPQIIAPRSPVELEGFDFEDMDEDAIPVLINRLVRFPPARYLNASQALDVVDGPLDAATERVADRLDQENDIRTGVIQGPEHVWGFSILAYVGQMIARSAPSNVGEFLERFGLETD